MTDKKNNEEVDLGSLFVIIGKGIYKLVNLIKSVFQGIFDFVIQILLFIRNNFLKIGLGILIGGIIGFGLEKLLPPKFESNLQVKPNFNSSRQLYNNIEFYNDLIKQKDTLSLANLFKISSKEASSLINFKIIPIKNESNIFNAYTEIIEDSTKAMTFSYKKFKKGFTKYDYDIQKIIVVSKNNRIFYKLTNPIISSITKNIHYKKLKDIADENRTRSEVLIKRNLVMADSLQSTYQKVLLAQSKRENKGTNINMSSVVNNKELQLFKTNRLLNSDLDELAKQRSEKSEVIIVISDFQLIGHKIGSKILKNKTIILAVFGGFFVILGLLFLSLNNYLKNYPK